MSRRKHVRVAGWSPCGWILGRGRARAWRHVLDAELVVRHCGHPTALRPYYVRHADDDLVHELGTFSLLGEAQLAAYAWRFPVEEELPA